MHIDPTATVASTAVIEGDVRIGAHSHISHGAIVVAGGGVVTIGDYVTVMENAMLRATARFPLEISHHCLIGPHVSLSGATVESEVFIATGASVFPGATLGRGSEVRINGVVQLRTRLEPGATVPIGWVAVGNPAVILPVGDHDGIWAIQEQLDFPGFVFGVDRSRADAMIELTERVARSHERGES